MALKAPSRKRKNNVNFKKNYKKGEQENSEGQFDEEGDKRKYDNIVHTKGKKAAQGSFQYMGLTPAVLKGITRRGYKLPTPIQRKTIPVILGGRDVVAMARTGSGKTAAFLIPMFEKLLKQKLSIGQGKVSFPRGLVLAPTRELAMQTVKFFKELGKFVSLSVVAILGGDSMESQFAAIHEKPDVIVATPGRLMHICVEMELKLEGVEMIVFDEADRLFEMGFGEQIMEIIRRLPVTRQTLLFSATLPKALVEFSKAGLNDPVLIRLDLETKLPEQLALKFYCCRHEDKMATLLSMLRNLIDQQQQTIVFVATKHHVELLHWVLDECDISNCYIYSSLDPSARKIAVEKFRLRKCNIMIVTDIAARGIDIPILDNVINFHFPPKPKLFLHRVGRVARAGRSGVAYSIVSPDELAFLFDLHLFLSRPIVSLTNNQAFDDKSIVLAKVPQDIVNLENGKIRNLKDTKSDMAGLLKVSSNGYTHYLKSRPNASAESNKRSKQVSITTLQDHPDFSSFAEHDPVNDLIGQMQSYRPKSTIFEIGTQSSLSSKVMRMKRKKDQDTVEKQRECKSSVPVDEAAADLSTAFQTKCSDSNNFIPYVPKDHHTESGLVVGTTFDKLAHEASFDLTGDDSEALKKRQKMLKWDNKKKRYVGSGNAEKSKKIKTESGIWIASSYKSDRYKKWRANSKIEHQEAAEDSEDSDDNVRRSRGIRNLKPSFSRKLVKMGKNAPKKNAGLKRPEQILKSRKLKEKNQMRNAPKSSRKKGSKKR